MEYVGEKITRSWWDYDILILSSFSAATADINREFTLNNRHLCLSIRLDNKLLKISAYNQWGHYGYAGRRTEKS